MTENGGTGSKRGTEYGREQKGNRTLGSGKTARLMDMGCTHGKMETSMKVNGRHA